MKKFILGIGLIIAILFTSCDSDDNDNNSNNDNALKLPIELQYTEWYNTVTKNSIAFTDKSVKLKTMNDSWSKIFNIVNVVELGSDIQLQFSNGAYDFITVKNGNIFTVSFNSYFTDQDNWVTGVYTPTTYEILTASSWDSSWYIKNINPNSYLRFDGDVMRLNQYTADVYIANFQIIDNTIHTTGINNGGFQNYLGRDEILNFQLEYIENDDFYGAHYELIITGFQHPVNNIHFNATYVNKFKHVD